ncbi:MAG: hypothetical protein MJH11_10575, partial [Lentisphaeria bacterium]|nr:hypothetical protein [Lentisphaeria bacterium]
LCRIEGTVVLLALGLGLFIFRGHRNGTVRRIGSFFGIVISVVDLQETKITDIKRQIMIFMIPR